MRKAAFGVAIGLGVLALSFAVLGLVLNNQASFSKHYVHDQLAEKQITFTPVENLLPNQKTVPCLVENAGQQLVSGKQAECYANNYIAVHLREVNDGKTYSQTSSEQRALPDQNSPEAKELDGKVQTLFRGETLRGLLLTSYGFSIFGDRAQTAAYVCYILALVLFLAAIAGFVHAATKSAEQPILTEGHGN